MRLLPIDFTSAGQLPAEAQHLKVEIATAMRMGWVEYRRSKWSHEQSRRIGLALTPAGHQFLADHQEER